jgi:hypothetical protein
MRMSPHGMMWAQAANGAFSGRQRSSRICDNLGIDLIK